MLQLLWGQDGIIIVVSQLLPNPSTKHILYSYQEKLICVWLLHMQNYIHKYYPEL